MCAGNRRFVILLALAAALLAGCGNFSLSSLLDTPPGGPIGITTLSLAPTTVNATTSSAVQFTARGGILPYTWAADAGSPPANGLYTVPAHPARIPSRSPTPRASPRKRR